MKKMYYWVLMCVPFLGLAQDINTSMPNVSLDSMLAINKEIYTPIEFNYNLVTYDLATSVDKLPKGEMLNKNYLSSLLKELEKDSLNPIKINDVGRYYMNKGNHELAFKYYKSALDHMDKKYFEKDSSYFYSSRAVIKVNLGDSTALNDFNKAIVINPKDTLAFVMYPMYLIENKEYEKSKGYVSRMFDLLPEDRGTVLIYLSIIEVFETLNAHENDAYGTKLMVDSDEFVDYSLLDKYVSMYKDDKSLYRASLMIDLVRLSLTGYARAGVGASLDEINYSQKDWHKLEKLKSAFKKLIKKKELNAFTANKQLGVICLLMKDREEAITYFNKAIEALPDEKSSWQFNSNSCYDYIALIYNLQSKDALFKDVLEAKMVYNASEPEATINDLKSIAYNYFCKDDYKNAEKYATKIREIERDNFDALLLLSTINFYNGKKLTYQILIEDAMAQVKNEEQYDKFILQLIINQMLSEDYESVKKNMEIAKQLNENSGIYVKLKEILDATN